MNYTDGIIVGAVMGVMVTIFVFAIFNYLNMQYRIREEKITENVIEYLEGKKDGKVRRVNR